MESLISSDNTWVLWAIITCWAAMSIYLEQTYKWAAKVSGAIIALVGAMVLSNLKIIPMDAPVYDIVWGYVIPLAIPLLLFQCNISKIVKESGRVLVIYLLSAGGTVLGAMLAFSLLSSAIPEAAKITGMMTGSYIGGSVNFVAMAEAFEVSGEMVSATVVADNLLMALYFLVLIMIPSVEFFRKHFNHPHVLEVESVECSDEETVASAYWGKKEISLKDIAFSVASAFAIVAISGELAKFFASAIPTTGTASGLANSLLGNKYLIITTLTMALATALPNFFGNIRGSQEIGTFLIYLFFMVIGVPASIGMIISKSPMLLVFCGIMVFVNMVISFGLGKIFKFDIEEIILASNANIGGPTTAAAMAISKGWNKLIGPIMLVGILGYIIGNYFGIFMGTMLGA